MRRYFGGDAVNARLRLEKGQIESDSPEQTATSKTNPNSRRDIRIRTPKATAAVRGTKFRVADSAEKSASGVLTGTVTWASSVASQTDGALSLAAGFGSSADVTGKISKPEPLLAAPELVLIAETVRRAEVTVPFRAVPGAVGYRIRVAANTEFSRELTEQVTDQNSFALNSIRDGNHFVAVRAISPNGIEGKEGLGKLSFLARPFAPTIDTQNDQSPSFNDQVLLQWNPEKQATVYKLQIAADDQFENIQLERRVKGTQFAYQHRRNAKQTGLAQPYWRVASIDGWIQGPFSDAQQFSLRPAAPSTGCQAKARGRINFMGTGTRRNRLHH